MIEAILGKKYKKVLVIGAGGGNDIVSACLPAFKLQAHGTRVDIAGLLNPRFTHDFNGNGEAGLNVLAARKYRAGVVRSVLARTLLETDFINPSLAAIVQTRTDIGKVFDFSLRGGTRGMSQTLNDLVVRECYDAVIGLDIGGDILSRPQDAVLSPLMDLHTLYALANVPNIDTYLVETGLGADGELDPQTIDQIMTELIAGDSGLIDTSIMDPHDPAVMQYADIYNNHIVPIRAGNTGRMLLQSLGHDARKGDIPFDYEESYRLGSSEWKHRRRAYVSGNYAGKVYTFDAKKLARCRRVPATSNGLATQLVLKVISTRWGSELDLQQIFSARSWITDRRTGICMLFLTVPDFVPADKQAMLFTTGLGMLDERSVDACLMRTADAHKTGRPARPITDTLSVVTAKEDRLPAVHAEIRKGSEYSWL